ncbi:MAG TPA: glycosyltransferase family 2 protein [Actinomycetota bacterium]|jgi:glycosyltransferase involved in cell wall biosynthesis|nr:glycosyltransferase family 2 protein [Actinomycetota bacterium]
MPDVILPVLNEVSSIPWVLGRMPAGYRPIVVDNGSTDDSASVARELHATVVAEPRRGFGAACAAGLAAAEADIVAFMDCDGSLDPADLPTVVGPVAAGGTDLVLGMRVTFTRGSWPAHARVANRVLARLVCRRTGLALRDLGPMRAARRAALMDLAIRDRRFGWPLEMVVRAADAGWRVNDVPVPYYPRRGRSKVTGTALGTARTVRDMAEVLSR